MHEPSLGARLVRLPALVLSCAVLALAGCVFDRPPEPSHPPAEDLASSALAADLPAPDRVGTVDTTPVRSEPLMPEQTIGEQRVRLDHNPAGDPVVTALKRAGGALVDAVLEARSRSSIDSTVAQNERNRCLAIAATYAETATMWAVKGVTTDTSSSTAGRGSSPAAGDEEAAELRRQIASLEEQLASARQDRDAFAGKATARDRTIEDLRLELERRPDRPT